MPGWHEATKQLQADGRIRMVGIIQEQHPDRARLFMQWKQLPWPVLVDSQDQLGVAVVPITLFIDEHGIVRNNRPKPGDAEAFADATFDAPAEPVTPPPYPDLARLRNEVRTARSEPLMRYGAGLVDLADAKRMGEAIGVYGAVLQQTVDNGPAHFRRGVAYLRRAESDYRKHGDFQHAIDEWSAALAIDPNQYIWRRRIEQYGARLAKPYPFYDWVVAARRDIEQRGETPVELRVEPGGAEIAAPLKTMERQGMPPIGDVHDRIARDANRYIVAETTVVPSAVEPGTAARVHVVFRPNRTVGGHWNNESSPLTVWVRSPALSSHETPNAGTAVSGETRRVEFEVYVPEGTEPGEFPVNVYALYNVCEGENAACLYRRLDLPIEITVK